MKLIQLSLFLENRPGQLRVPCEVLGKAGVDMLTLSLADTRDFGILRLLVREPSRARAALEAAGCVVKETEVLAVEVPDRPGGLGEVLAGFDRAGVGIEYGYALASGSRDGRAVLVFRVADPDAAARRLPEAGVKVLSREEVLGA
ncbi:MAG TPA: amino acid-binding protein [Anaeromyxobacteraceae bacterium]|nr:amino acid-binding protein [Anaeromyxobacteraceae bacterium]